MAFITLQRAADDPNQDLLVNTEHIVSVELKAYDGPLAATHQIDVKTVRQEALTGYFSTLEKARTAYNSLSGYLAPDATIIFY